MPPTPLQRALWRLSVVVIAGSFLALLGERLGCWGLG
jgi:hypothetical protein